MDYANISKGNLFTVSAPSGAGKSTLLNALLEQDPFLELSISYTTRQPRPGEQNGREYHFTTADDFLERDGRGEFLESARVHGNYYGTSRLAISEQIKTGKDILLEIDWQGARQIRNLFPTDTTIFILPPSIQSLQERLTKRGQDSIEVIEQRILAANEEIQHAPEFDYVIINSNFDEALSQLVTIVKSIRYKFMNQAIHHADLFRQFGIYPNKNV